MAKPTDPALAACQKNVATLTAQLATVTQQLADANARIVQLTDEVLVRDNAIADRDAIILTLNARVSTLEADVARLTAALAACEGTTEPPPSTGAVVLYRDTYKDGKHSPALAAAPGFAYEATTAPFVFLKDDLGRDVFRLNIPADGNDNRNEQRFHGFGRLTEYFVGFKRRMSPDFTHENAVDSTDNWKQLRMFSEPYETNGIHTGFSLLPGNTPEGTGLPSGQILFEFTAPNGFYPAANKGTWDRLAYAGLDERWGFYLKLASGPNAKDGIAQFWYQGFDLMKKQMDAQAAAGKPVFNWNALDLWDYSATPRNYFDKGFYPGWDNAGSLNTEYLDYQEFVLATKPLAEYITP